MFLVVIKSINQAFDETKSLGAGEGEVIIEGLHNKLSKESWKLK